MNGGSNQKSNDSTQSSMFTKPSQEKKKKNKTGIFDEGIRIGDLKQRLSYQTAIAKEAEIPQRVKVISKNTGPVAQYSVKSRQGFIPG